MIISILLFIFCNGFGYITSGQYISKDALLKIKRTHKPKNLSEDQIKLLLNHLNYSLFLQDLKNILIPRVSGTEGNKKVTSYILRRLKDDIGMKTENYTHCQLVPVLHKDRYVMFHGRNDIKNSVVDNTNGERIGAEICFNNLASETNPDALRSLVLACHHDSKYRLEEYKYKQYQKAQKFRAHESEFENNFDSDQRFTQEPQFLGATDSAIPCAIMINLAQALSSPIRCNSKNREDKISLQMLFFDGEEAFDIWSPDDSLYGSRHMANLYQKQFIPLGERESNGKINMLERIGLFVLLDLIGEKSTRFYDFFPSTNKNFQHLVNIENRLHSYQLLSPSNTLPLRYFTNSNLRSHGVEDDHIPFLEKGVKILHLISYPFPHSWHKFDDDGTNADFDTILDITKILAVFIAEYLNLRVDTSTMAC
ncbi:unnamed protein product [Gordionus sp. m RMFG-2023]|uniref:glutaminyl-peptide cyclotransferase-like isoform X2 n=1 Tax=Gordionus sp. m RMFG-2023 TaxID=3053472 RepID=UPI0030DE374C